MSDNASKSEPALSLNAEQTNLLKSFITKYVSDQQDSHGAQDAFTTQSKALEAGSDLLNLLPSLGPFAEVGTTAKHKLLEQLADAYYEQYEQTGDFDTLEAAGDKLFELSADIDEDDFVNTSRIRYKSSRYLWSRFLHYKNENDLENATDAARIAVEDAWEELQQDIGLLAERKLQLCFCLCTQATQLGQYNPMVLEEACILNDEVCRALQDRHNLEHLQIQALESLSNCLLIRWENSTSPERMNRASDLQRVIEIATEVCQMLEETSELDAKAKAFSNLSYVYRIAHQAHLNQGLVLEGYTQQEMEHLGARAIDELTRSLQLASGPLHHVRNIMLFADHIAEYQPGPREEMLARLFPMLRQGVQMLQDILYTSQPEDRREHVKSFYGLSRYAAAAALQANAGTIEALQLLEQGRAVTMSMQLGLVEEESELENTSSNSPALSKYNKSRSRLIHSIAEREPWYKRRQRLVELYDTRQEAQQDLPATETLKYLEENALLSLSSNGPIVVINITDVRCDAFIITIEGISLLPLPNLREVELSEKSWVVQQGLAKMTDEPDLYSDTYKNMFSLLKHLWTALVLPIFDHLKYENVESNWPHITWIPTGVLSLCPIHAAGLGLHKKANVVNRVVSHYAPTLRVLAFNKAGLHYQQKADASIHSTVITMTKTPARGDLVLGEAEYLAIHTHFPSATRVHESTGREVLDAFKNADAPSIVHFSCHGDVDYDSPWKSFLLMRDWQEDPLTVDRLRRSIRKSDGAGFELAFLSACFTANAGVEGLQDEAEHVASTMLAAGFKTVVGSLWEVEEDAALSITQSFYEHLARFVTERQSLNTLSIAEALHLSVLDLASTSQQFGQEGDPLQWAPFVCFGA